MFSFELVYFASFGNAFSRLKIFGKLGPLEIAGGLCVKTLQRRCRPDPNPMRFKLLPALLLTIVFAGEAFAALVVEKRSRQLPFVEVFECQGVHSFVFRGPTGTSRKPILVPPEEYWSARKAGLYKFVLRYHSGNVCARLVTPEVFARYRVGDDFRDGDLMTERVTDDNKSVQPVMHHRRHTAQIRKHGNGSHHVAKRHRLHRTRLVAQR